MSRINKICGAFWAGFIVKSLLPGFESTDIFNGYLKVLQNKEREIKRNEKEIRKLKRKIKGIEFAKAVDKIKGRR